MKKSLKQQHLHKYKIFRPTVLANNLACMKAIQWLFLIFTQRLYRGVWLQDQAVISITVRFQCVPLLTENWNLFALPFLATFVVFVNNIVKMNVAYYAYYFYTVVLHPCPAYGTAEKAGTKQDPCIHHSKWLLRYLFFLLLTVPSSASRHQRWWNPLLMQVCCCKHGLIFITVSIGGCHCYNTFDRAQNPDWPCI